MGGAVAIPNRVEISYGGEASDVCQAVWHGQSWTRGEQEACDDDGRHQIERDGPETEFGVGYEKVDGR